MAIYSVLSGRAEKELLGKGLALDGADTGNKCTTKNVMKPLSLNALNAIAISKIGRNPK